MGQKCPAVDVLVQGEKYLNADQLARIQQERSSRPRLSPLFGRAIADFEVQKPWTQILDDIGTRRGLRSEL